ncbi:MAG TPA: hypothetical protein VHA80_01640 [Solirubrobacterales bacterium]|nr:hypothetical protein [Solirubrobacterales bacterium]
MPGAVEASAEFDHDALATVEEIQHSGENVLRWLEALAGSEDPWPVDLTLVREIHFRWFETTFPADAGQFRTQMVLNRKGTAVEVETILPAVQGASENWAWRRKATARPTTWSWSSSSWPRRTPWRSASTTSTRPSTGTPGRPGICGATS